MAKIKKKGQVGAARNYITRNQAIRKLQISLPDFRRLCIWKGIFPREPRSRKKVSRSSTNSTTFYYAKDVQYLLHEPLLRQFREHKALEKKISRALGRGDVSDARRLDAGAARPDRTGRPRHPLDHVVRERYPTFADALRDLDDCLSMLFLFANLPASDAVPARMVARCERLCFEFQHYLIVSRSLRKSFLSIKGIYYQATVHGEDVLWLVPYRFNQRVVGDVDFRIMGTFVEFYMTLLGFVNFRLYTSIGLRYPPKFDRSKDDGSAELGALTLEGKPVLLSLNGEAESKLITVDDQGGDGDRAPDPELQRAVDRVIEGLDKADTADAEKKRNELGAEAMPAPSMAVMPTIGINGTTDGEIVDIVETEALDKFEPAAPGGDVLPQPASAGTDTADLFADCTFFLSREAPRQPLEFLLRAFGCKRIGWDAVLGEGAFTTDERDPRITHQVVDRPPVQAAVNGDAGDGEDNQTARKLGPNQRMPGRTYVQPQWVWDSVNDGEMKRPDLYVPGASLPPHLSPFVRAVQGQYDPSMPLEEQEDEGEAEEADDAESNDSFGGFSADEEEQEEEEEIGKESEEEEADDTRGPSGREVVAGKDTDEDCDGEDKDRDEQDAIDQRHAELEAEISGVPVKSDKAKDPRAQARDETRQALARKSRDEAEDLERAKGMLSKKKRKLFEQMQYTNSKKSEEAKVLRAKRRKIEKAKKKAS